MNNHERNILQLEETENKVMQDEGFAGLYIYQLLKIQTIHQSKAIYNRWTMCFAETTTLFST